MCLLKWFYTEIGSGSPPPDLVYYALRGGMFVLSFVLEDWAIYELVPSPRYRRATVVLVASSYVTWTYQTHTFSNSLETLLVAWGLVLIRRIVGNKVRQTKLQGTQCTLTTLLATLVPRLSRRARLHRRGGCLQPYHFPSFPFIPGPAIAASVPAQVRRSIYPSPPPCQQRTCTNPALAPDHSRSQYFSSSASSFPSSQSMQTPPSTGRQRPSLVPSVTL